MPTLNWIGKEAVVNHDKEVPFRLLKKVKAHSVGDNSQNLIIHGDNLEALKALMPYYQGKVKCIYIDPPYNTGNESWVYNDKVNSPKIKKWLGKVVGGESEDLCRHDKWLCMMYPRLKLLRDLLSEDGVIFISIDDNEHCNMRMLLDELFDESNFLASIVWQKRYSASNDATGIVAMHDYIVVYRKSNLFKRNLLPRTEKQNKLYKNDDRDGKGLWRSDNLLVKTFSQDYVFPIKNPNTGKEFLPPKGSCWRAGQATIQRWLAENRIFFGKDGKGAPQLKRYLNEVQQGIVPTTWWPFEEAGHNDEANKEIKSIFGEKAPFDTPKPTRLINRVLRLSTDKDSIILDSFAGSGTTAHSVLDLNKEDAGKRKFILIEMEDKVAKDITAERVKRAIIKYDYKDGFEYCELDKSLFNEEGQIEEECNFEQLATYIYFTETNTNIAKRSIDKHFIGEYNETEFYLLFKEKGKNILNKDFLRKINKNNKKKIIYADKCLIDDMTLEKLKIQFKQIPYEVKVY